MKLPRDVTGPNLVSATEEKGQHHEVIPNHYPIKTGTLSGILKSIAAIIK